MSMNGPCSAFVSGKSAHWKYNIWFGTMPSSFIDFFSWAPSYTFFGGVLKRVNFLSLVYKFAVTNS